jgi:Domain of unknown function (DUF4419)
MVDRMMLDRIKSLLESRKRELITQGPGIPALSPTAEDHEIAHIQPAARTDNGIVFPVDDVVPASDPLWVGTLRESVEIRTDASILIMPDQEIPAIAPEGYSTKPAPNGPRMPWRVAMRAIPEPKLHPPRHLLARAQTFLHPLVQAVHIAFSDHRPLVLTPDCIWLTIVQGFGHHVLENAEALRHRLVRHEGKKELSVVTKSLSPDLWPSFMSSFSGLIRENSDPVLHETLLCEFSTTTPAMKTAYEIALMDTYQRYFDYGLMCVCGIPEITLQGTVEDWQRITDRIEVLATYDLEWWTSRLTPILDEFVATASGKPDREFWQAIYKPQKAYAAELASGWICDLFPYLFAGRREPDERPGRGLCDSPSCHRNRILSETRTNWLLPSISDHPFAGRGVPLKHFPSGLSRVPVTVQLPDDSKTKIEVMGGFVGVSQRAEDNALSPIIHWAVLQKGA